MHLPATDAWFTFPDWLQDGRIAFIEVEASYPEQTDFGPPIIASKQLVIGEQTVKKNGCHVIATVWAPDGSRVASLTPIAFDTIENELQMFLTTP